MINEIKGSEIHLSYDDSDFSSIRPGNSIVGQDKALGLLRLGLSIERSGYNIFISGDEGSGRLTAVMQEIKAIESDIHKLRDAAYVYSTHHLDRPNCLLFMPGMARVFQKDLTDYGKGIIGKDEIESKWSAPEISRFISSLPPYSETPEAYEINIAVDRTGATRRPVVIETHPSHQSLFGHTSDSRPQHLAVRIGSYQAAAGGFLVMRAEEIVSNQELWTTLKRYIEMTDRAMSSTAVQGEMQGSIRPKPIPLQTKVILLGSENTYSELSEKDSEFLRLFKVSPEFDYSMPATKENIEGTVSYLKSVIDADDSAYSEILRFSSWVAEDRSKLTTQLGILGDLLEEASLIAPGRITGSDVRKALSNRDWYGSLSEDKINSEIKNGEMIMDLKGRRVGIVNGLAVMDRGVTSFGTPTVISATVAPGNEGIVNIEHEAGLSGGIHDKGLLILEGYLRHRYARSFPLSLYAGICFEQSYAEVDGDSASSAELYALLSAIGEIPLRQDIAVTGSVNQMGELQPVGGINEKIQGFFNACSTCGLTGTQGVIIPKQNLSALILPYNVEKAVMEGSFHLYTITEIDEGMEILSDMKAGVRDRKGAFQAGSFNRLIEDSLRRLCRNSQERG